VGAVLFWAFLAGGFLGLAPALFVFDADMTRSRGGRDVAARLSRRRRPCSTSDGVESS
jgi:hypothetical protein